jgi:hypothetical protein
LAARCNGTVPAFGFEFVSFFIGCRHIGIYVHFGNVFFDGHGIVELAFARQELFKAFNNALDILSPGGVESSVAIGKTSVCSLVWNNAFADRAYEQAIAAACGNSPPHLLGKALFYFGTLF